MKTVQTKQEFEAAFKLWAAGGEFDGVVENIEGIYRALEPYTYATDYYNETVRAVEISSLAMSIARLYLVGHEDLVTFDSEKAADIMEGFYKDYYLPIDKECFVALMNEFDKNMSEEFKPQYFKDRLAQFGSI